MTDISAERNDLIETLDAHRDFLRFTANGLSDEQAAAAPTVSVLSIGGLIKHVTATESGWVEFILNGPAALGDADSYDPDERAAQFEMRNGETLAALLDRYAEVADRTNQLVLELADLDVSQPLPEAPWFPPGARRSTATRVHAHHRRNRATRRARRHHPRDTRRHQDHGMTRQAQQGPGDVCASTNQACAGSLAVLRAELPPLHLLGRLEVDPAGSVAWPRSGR